MNNSRWYKKRIAVLGYGIEGRSSVNYFLKQGAKIEVHDALPLEKLNRDSLESHHKQEVVYKLENEAFVDLHECDLVMRTPTFSPFHPALSRLRPDQVSSQANLFLERWRDQSIGITGTKGKGTTASLLHQLLTLSGRKCLLGGNIGTPLLDIIDKMSSNHIAVLELSSYQLWDARTSPGMAILLAVYPEHLDVHGSLDSYLAAKQNLLRFQKKDDLAIILTDAPLSRHISNLMPAQQHKIASGWSESGAILEGLIASINVNGTAFEVAVEETRLRGAHNAGNIAAAVVAATLSGVRESEIRAALPKFQPLPHRLELVQSYNRITFYDDSIATTPEATIAAINSFNQPIVLWLGGINPSADWSQLVAPLSKSRVVGCVLLGTSAPEIYGVISESNLPIETLVQPKDYDSAVEWSVNLLEPSIGGVVLLSPGAKSFDQFTNYTQRGEAFQKAIIGFLDSRAL